MPFVPFVSVIIAVKDEGATIRTTLDAMRLQKYPHDRFEVIIVDGGSRDGTIDYIENYIREHASDRDSVNMRLISGIPRRGPSDARNAGVLESKGEIIAFTDGDCVPSKNWLEELIPPYSDKDVGGVGGALRYVDLKNSLSRLEDLFAMANYRGFITSNMSYRKEAFIEVGMFDESLCCAEDADVYLRIRDAGWRVVYVDGAEVYHDPPENRSWYEYTKKQFWFAKSDVGMIKKRLGLLVKDRYMKEQKGKLERTSSWRYFANWFLPAFSDIFLILSLVVFLVAFYIPFLSIIGVAIFGLWILTICYVLYWRISNLSRISEKVRYENKMYLYFLYPFYVLWMCIVRGLGSIWGWLGIFSVFEYRARKDAKKSSAVPQ